MLMQLFRDLFAGRRSQRLLARARASLGAGNLDDAERACTACAQIAPHLAELHYLRGMIALRRGNPEAALPLLQGAAAVNDTAPAFQAALGTALHDLGAHERAIEHLKRALELLPPDGARHIELKLLLADSLQERTRAAEAEALVREVLAAQPNNAGAMRQLAMLRFVESDGDEARRLMDRCVGERADAGTLLRRALMMPIILQSNAQIDALRTRLDEDLDRVLAERLPPMRHPESEVLLTPFFLAYHGRNNRDVLAKFGRAYRAHYPARKDISRRVGRGRRLRVGFVSTFFYAHSVGRTTFGLIKDLPREHFETYVFSISRYNDETTEEIRRAAEHFAAVPADVDKARAAIEAAELDVLLYADIGMHPVTTFLSLWRLAPVQLVTWGHSITSGIDSVDYYVSSEVVETPQSDALYTEKLIRLPGYFMPRYHRPAIHGARKSREELGLPAGRHLYLCPQSLVKLHPDFDAALRGILERDPQAEIVLLRSRASWMELLRQRFARSLGEASSRVHFMPNVSQRDFLHYLGAADVIIDPFHFGGCNTSCEALALGVPIVTLPAFQLPGRFTLGLYRELGLDACIARSAGDFVDLAVRVGTDADYRRSLSAEISQRCEQLFERPDVGRALGDALLRIAS